MPVVGDFETAPIPSKNLKYSRIADIFRALAIPVNFFLASEDRYSTTSTFSTSEDACIDTLFPWRYAINCRISVWYALTVAALLFLPAKESRNVASPFSSVMVCMSAPVFVMSPLLSHTDQKQTRAGHLLKMVPITWCFFHYMVSLLDAVKADSGRSGSGKRDYRTQMGC